MHITIRKQLGILLLLIISAESCSCRSLWGGGSNNPKGAPLTNQKNNTDTSANSNEGVNINTKNGAGDTQLHMAIDRDDEAAINRLIQHPGIDINITDKDGKTPLQRAITKGNKKVIEKLLANKANPNIKNNEGNTALHLAADSAQDELIIQNLLDNGAHVAVKNTQGKTPLDNAINVDKPGAVGMILDKMLDEINKGTIPLKDLQDMRFSFPHDNATVLDYTNYYRDNRFMDASTWEARHNELIAMGL